MILRRFVMPSLVVAFVAACLGLLLSSAATTAKTPLVVGTAKSRAVRAASGGEITLRSSTITAGSVISTGGDFSAQSTSGQPAAANLTGGDYEVTGGFLSPVLPPTSVSDLTGLDKSRFISFSIPTSAFGETALRVKFITLHRVVPPYTGGASIAFTLFEGQSMYVGPPTQYVESESSGTLFYASFLQCTPHYRDWTTVGLLHVTGEAIMPSSSYEVENLASSCLGNEANCAAVSAALTIATTRWGDVVALFNPPDPSDQPDFDDISALVNKFKSATGAPIKARGMLAGESGGRGLIKMDLDLGFTHISACIDAFKRLPYPYKPGKCMGAPATACKNNTECVGTTGPCILCP